MRHDGRFTVAHGRFTVANGKFTIANGRFKGLMDEDRETGRRRFHGVESPILANETWRSHG